MKELQLTGVYSTWATALKNKEETLTLVHSTTTSNEYYNIKYIIEN